MTQTQKVKAILQAGASSIADLWNKTKDIPRESLRRAIYTGVAKGDIIRLGKGVYTLASDETVGYIQVGDALEAITTMADTGTTLKFKVVLLDIPYYSYQLIGRNRRKIKDQYEFITPEYFGKVCAQVKRMITEKSSVIVMLSGARTAQPDMNKYLEAAKEHLHFYKEGGYTKLYADGSPVLNIRGVAAAAERLILMTKEPVLVHYCEPDLNFSLIRPKGYNTEKPIKLLTGLLAACAQAHDWILDLFAGSGVTGLAASLMGNNYVLVEKSQDTVDNFILPKLTRQK